MCRTSKRTPLLPVIVAALIAVLCVTSRQAAAQPIASNLQLANPSALEFRLDGETSADTEYHVELIRAGEAPATAQPVNVWDGRAASHTDDGLVRIDLEPLVAGVADGEYVATLTVVGAGAAPRRSAVVGPFMLYGHASPDGHFAQSTGGAVEDHGRERMWTRIAIAAAAGLMIIPFLLR